MDPEKRILQLIARRMGREISAEESRELESLLKRYPEMHYFMEIMESREHRFSPWICDDTGKKSDPQLFPGKQPASGGASTEPAADEPDTPDPS